MKKCALMAVLAAVLLLATNASAQMIPGTSIVAGYVKDEAGNPIEGCLVRVIDESSGAEVGNCTTDVDGFYAIRVWFPSVGMKMTANITASKEGYHTNYTITTLTGSLPPEIKTINFTLKEILTPTPTLSFEPMTQDVVLNETKTMNLSGYNITVRLSNGSVAEIISVEFPAWATLKDNSTLPADSVWLKAADLNDEIKRNERDVILATLTIRGDDIGNTEIIADINRMDNDDGNPISPSVRNGTFIVGPELTPFVYISTDKTEYTTGDIMLANITIANPTEETKHVIFNWWVTVPSKGFYTAPLATMPMTLPPAYNKTFTYPITVGYWGAENFGAVFCVALTNQTSGKIISFDATFWNYEARGAREAGEKSIESIVSEIKRASHR